jgi:hypothetical protein
MQNLQTKGGVQEKLVHAWLARAVPVYYGPPEAVAHYNPDSFINCEFSADGRKVEHFAELHELRMSKMAEHIQRNLKLYESVEHELWKGRKDMPINMDLFEQSEEFEQLLSKTRELFREDFKSCVDKVKAVDQDEGAWRKMVSAPVVAGNKLNGSYIDIRRYASRFREVLRNAESYLVGAEGA